MAIDLSKLSAKELFELALRKEQEEQLQTKRHEQLIELQKQRAMLLSAHQVSLAEIERKISELTSQRGKLLAEHEKSMITIGKEIGDLTRKIQEVEQEKAAKPATPPPAAARPAAPVTPPPAPTPVAPPPAPAAVAPTPAPPAPRPVSEVTPPVEEEAAESVSGSEALTIHDKDELFEKIREMMRSRSFISHGLLKEQLKVKGFNVPNLSKLVDQLIREGKLASAGGGNYALGKKA